MKRQNDSENEVENLKLLRKKNYYEILQISKDASLKQIKSGFKRQALKFHPDKNASVLAREAFSKVNQAYSILKDEALKRQYDQTNIRPQKPNKKEQKFDCSKKSRQSKRQKDKQKKQPRQQFNYKEQKPQKQQKQQRDMKQQSSKKRSPQKQKFDKKPYSRAGINKNPRREVQSCVTILVGIILTFFVVKFLSFRSRSQASIFSLNQNQNFPLKIKSNNIKVPFYVSQKFLNQEESNIKKIHIKAEQFYIINLIKICNKSLKMRSKYENVALNNNQNQQFQKQKIIELKQCKKILKLKKKYPQFILRFQHLM